MFPPRHDAPADPSLGCQQRPVAAPPFLYRLCSYPTARVVMVVVLLVVGPWAVYRAVRDLASDLPNFASGGQYVLDHGYRHPLTALDRYLPSLDVACVLLTILPLWLTAILYYLLNAGTWFALLNLVRDGLLAADDWELRERGTMAAGLLALVIAADGFLVGAFHVLMVWLMAAGLLAASRGRAWQGGLLLGTAVWLKLLPIVGVGYLVLKRKWLSAAVAVTFALSLDLVLSLAAFGWQNTIDEHLIWAAGGAVATVDHQLGTDYRPNEDRITNQSLFVVARRLLTTRAEYSQLAVADLSPRALSIVTGGALLTLGAVVLYAIRRPAAELSAADWGAEIALIVLCTIWISPVVWSYHFTACVPALAVVLAHPHDETRKRIVTAAWMIGLVLFTLPLGRAAGHMLWASLVLGGVLVNDLRRDTPSKR